MTSFMLQIDSAKDARVLTIIGMFKFMQTERNPSFSKLTLFQDNQEDGFSKQDNKQTKWDWFVFPHMAGTPV